MSKQKTVFLLGDFNINLLQSNASSNILNNIITATGLTSTIMCPTRITDHTSSLLDLCFTNCDSYISGILTHHVSDHLPIFICASTAINKAKPPDDTLKIRNVNKDTLENFRHKVASIDWSLICKDVHDANTIYNLFFQTFESMYNDCFPLIKITRNKKFRKPWMNQKYLKT